jgi:hypothetical protein
MTRRVQLRTDVADNHFPVLVDNPRGVALHTGETAEEQEKGKNHVPALLRASHPLGGLLAPLVLASLRRLRVPGERAHQRPLRLGGLFLD